MRQCPEPLAWGKGGEKRGRSCASVEGWAGEQRWSRLIAGTHISPLASRQPGSHSICQHFFCFPSFYTFVHSHSPHHRKRQKKEWEGKREEKLSEKSPVQNTWPGLSRGFKIPLFSSSFTHSHFRMGLPLGSGRHSPLDARAQWLRATRHPSSARGCIPASPRRPECPPGQCSSLKTRAPTKGWLHINSLCLFPCQ